MQFYDVISARRTIRDFKQAPIDDETLERILAAGMKAPTNDHMRDWHFIVIRDGAVVRQLIEKIPARVSRQEVDGILQGWQLKDASQQQMYLVAIPKQYQMLAQASCVVVPLFRMKTDLFHPQSLSALNGFASIWCCIENLFLAATAEDYACALRIPIGDESEWTRQVLRYPADYLMPCFIAIGKPKDDAKHIAQKEYDLNERIHRDQW